MQNFSKQHAQCVVHLCWLSGQGSVTSMAVTVDNADGWLPS